MKLTVHCQTRLRLPLFQAQVAKFDVATRLLAAAIAAFIARNDNGSIPAARGLAEFGENVRTSTIASLLIFVDCVFCAACCNGSCR